MTDCFLDDLTLSGGVFRARLRGEEAPSPPRITLLIRGEAVGEAAVVETPDGWRLEAEAPAEAIGDGVAAIVFAAEDGSILARYPIAAGAALAEDLAAELASLRAELDQLKRAFRAELGAGALRRDERPLIVAEALDEVEALLAARDRAARSRRDAADGAFEEEDEAPWALEDDE
ncbi:MAG: hypothetical protein AAF322_03215 [Pseudomonadota bacterium]